MKNNKAKARNNSTKNRQYLVNKISDAMSLKYSNFFTAAKYDLKTLKDDVNKLLTTQYCTKDPRDVFKPIESNILDIVKKNNPQLQVKIKKARKLPEIKYTKDKYQEADEFEKEKEKPKIKENQDKNNSKSVVRRKSKAKSNKNLSQNANANEVKKDESVNKTNELKKQLTEVNDLIINKDNNNKDNNNINNINVNDIENEQKEEINNTTYRLQQEYGTKHTLVDKLKNKMKYDPTIKELDEEQKLFEKQQQEIKQKKILEQQNYLNDLRIQIEEKDKRKKEERQKELKELEEIQKIVEKEREEMKKKELEEKEKKEKIRQNYEKLLEEHKTIKKKQKMEEDKENKVLQELINEEIKNEKKSIIEKKNKIKEEILKTKEINEKLYKEKMNMEKPNEQLEEFVEIVDLMKNNSSSNKAIKDRINKRAMEQEAAGHYLLKIINSLDKKNKDISLVEQEREKQEQKKKLEYEMADKNRKLKLDDYKKSLLDILVLKNLEKEKQKEEEAKYRKSLEEEYNSYLKEEKERKMKQIEKYENYRKALEEQIKENRMRDIEKLKYK